MNAKRNERIVAVIPARYASQRLPAKPLAEIAGKPMVQHVVEKSARATLVDEVIVATDDERIASAVRAFGGTVVMTPVECRSGTDRIAHAAKSLRDASMIVNVQGDEPLIDPAMIDQAIRPLVDDPSIPVGTLVRRIESKDDLTNPGIVKVVLDGNGRCLYFSRSMIPFGRDIGPETWLRHHTYYKHIGLYVFRRDFLLRYAELPQTPLELMEKLEQLRILEHGFTINAVVTTFDSIPVDTAEDLQRVRALIGKRP